MLNNKLDQVLFLHPVPPCPKLKKWKRLASSDDAHKIEDAEDLFYRTQIDTKSKDLGLLEAWGGPANQRTRNIKDPVYRMVAKLFYTVCTLGRKDKNRSVLDVFSDIKNTIEKTRFDRPVDAAEAEKLMDSLNLMNNTYQTVVSNGTVETELDMAMSIYEAKEAGYIQTLSEEDLIRFVISSEMGLCFTDISSYNKPIPNDVIEKVKEADEKCIFDNFFILYYDIDRVKNIFYSKDFNKKAEAKEKEIIEAEKAKAKDPIIFGAIIGCTDLFYIADWEDENCSLTWDKLVKSIHGKSGE